MTTSCFIVSHVGSPTTWCSADTSCWYMKETHNKSMYFYLSHRDIPTRPTLVTPMMSRWDTNIDVDRRAWRLIYSCVAPDPTLGLDVGRPMAVGARH